MPEIPIKFCNVSKKYSINTGGISEFVRLCRKRIERVVRPGFSEGSLDPKREIWALKDVSFEVKKGEVLGIIGPNGAGKSTILKILSRITDPTKGTCEIQGRVGALIEIGAGFHDDLTGRENIFMNGAILGMKKKEIESKFDQIVEFAGLEKFIDTPLKKYSSGMRVRLGFAVAANLEPEVLLVDEVLAVGDVEFQGKSVKKMLSFKQKDIAIIFISHNMSSITAMCDRVLYLKEGQVKAIGDTQEMIGLYLRDFEGEDAGQSIQTTIRGEDFEIKKVSTLGQNGEEKQLFRYRDKMVIRVEYWFARTVRPFFSIVISGPSGPVSLMSMLADGGMSGALEGDGCLECVLDELPLLPGKYEIILHARREEGIGMFFKSKTMAQFLVDDSLEVYNFHGEHAAELARYHGYGSVFFPHQWRFPGRASGI